MYVAGAGEDRTHRGGTAAPIGFEDREAHQIPFCPHRAVKTKLYHIFLSRRTL